MPFVIYADFESVLKKPTNSDSENVCQIHEAFSVGYYLKCSYDDQLSYYRSYRGPEPAKWFVQELSDFSTFAEATFKDVKPMLPLTPEEQKAYDNATTCHICGIKGFVKNDKKRGKAADHCHLTGKFRGPAHIECNLNYQDSRTVSVVFHNLAGYDSHLLIKDLATHCPGRINLTPKTKEKYISFTKVFQKTNKPPSKDDIVVKFKFIDSFKFMNSSLDKLSSYLQKHDTLKSQFPGLSDELITLLCRKGVFPYSYLDCHEKLEETVLPPKEEFDNILIGKPISREDYIHAQRVWDTFHINNLGEYSDLYLKTDVMLLAEVKYILYLTIIFILNLLFNKMFILFLGL